MKLLFRAWLTIFLLTIIGFLIWFPSEKNIKSCMTTSMYKVELCAKSKNYVPLSQISKNIQNAVLLSEDAGFYQHMGFDIEGIEHCLKKMTEKYRIVCGGSTLTQQLAKNMFLYQNKNFLRKGVEALITVKLELTLTKREILEKYLNVVQFGKNIFGVKQACEFYFKKHPSQITPTEAAFLAMLLPNPDVYSQSYYKKDLSRFARKRVSHILRSLYRFGRIDSSTYEQSLANLDSFLKSKVLVSIKTAEPSASEEELSDETIEKMDALEAAADEDEENSKQNTIQELNFTPSENESEAPEEPAVEAQPENQ